MSIKRAIVVLADGFEEIEAVTPIDLLRRAGIEVIVAGLDRTTVTGARGVKVQCDTTLEQLQGDFDAIILPGGANGAKNLAASSRLSKLLVQFNQDQKLIAAICAAPVVVLTSLGILDNKNATCFPGMEQGFAKSTTFRDNRVVGDGNVITSRGPGTALDFSLSIIEKLTDKTLADRVRSAVLG